MIHTLSRVLFGFVLACLTAGLVQVLFVMTPGHLLAMPAKIFPERFGQSLVLAALAATHIAIFSAAFALIAVGLSEVMAVRTVGYYVIVGTVIALAGYAAQYASEIAGQPTVLNNYAFGAFVTSGIIAGLVYWLISGRRAGGRRHDTYDAAEPQVAEAPKRRWRDRPRIVIEDASMPGTKAGRAAGRTSLAERLAKEEATVDAAVTPAEAFREAADETGAPDDVQTAASKTELDGENGGDSGATGRPLRKSS